MSWVNDLPIERITGQAFLALDEYSATLPTGVFEGKRWRRLDGAHDPVWRARGGKPRWVIGEYVDAHVQNRPNLITIKWTRPVVICK